MPEIDEILKNDSLREYRIDIGTDSTIQIDKERRQAEARMYEGLDWKIDGIV